MAARTVADAKHTGLSGAGSNRAKKGRIRRGQRANGSANSARLCVEEGARI